MDGRSMRHSGCAGCAGCGHRERKKSNMKNFMKQFLMTAVVCVCVLVYGFSAQAAETADNEEHGALWFEIGTYSYEIIPEATEADMPPGFTLGDWEYGGQSVKAGFTENSDMVCVMAEDQETGYSYRFIYDPAHEMFTPYFGTEVKDGYIYTIPLYEGMEVPYGFHRAYFVIQTVPMFVFQRDDMELTAEEIALGILTEDAYLVFPMMNEEGEEICYTYDLVDRTFQRSMLQERDAEKVTEVNETADKLHQDISTLNGETTRRMNQRLTIIGILVAVVLIMTGVIISLFLKVSRLQKQLPAYEADEDGYDDAEDEAGSRYEFHVGQRASAEEEEFSEEEDFDDEEDGGESDGGEDLEILDLDEMDD